MKIKHFWKYWPFKVKQFLMKIVYAKNNIFSKKGNKISTQYRCIRQAGRFKFCNENGKIWKNEIKAIWKSDILLPNVTAKLTFIRTYENIYIFCQMWVLSMGLSYE